MTCSVCIATWRRPEALALCLRSLMRQTEPPQEIVVSDGDPDVTARAVVSEFASAGPWTIRYCPTARPALPWQRWWGFRHSAGSIILFLDDDVQLSPDAIATLQRLYRERPDIAGAGFAITYDGPQGLPTTSSRLRNRWLGMNGAAPGSILRGGITVDHPEAACTEVREVEWLSGGAMSFRRHVLEAIGPQDGLFQLYDQRIGKAEDAILSSRARRLGPLLLIAGTHARHPALTEATRTATAQDGFRRGLLETWGRAHVLHWLARDPAALQAAWARLATLELARALKSIAKRPGDSARWQRLAGDLVGIQRTLRQWHAIPPSPALAQNTARERS